MSRLCGIWGKNLERSGHQKKTQKSYCVTAQVLHWHHALFMWIYSVPVYVEFEAKIWRGLDTKKTQKAHFNRKKFALLEGLSHDLVCAGSNYHVHFTWQVWHGQYSPELFPGEIDRNHVDLKNSRGKGFALRRLNKHNFCPTSVFTFTFTPKTTQMKVHWHRPYIEHLGIRNIVFSRKRMQVEIWNDFEYVNIIFRCFYTLSLPCLIRLPNRGYLTQKNNRAANGAGRTASCIATSHEFSPQKVAEAPGNVTLFQENPGRWNVTIWPD